MFKAINLKNITNKAFISTLAAGSLLTIPGANEAAASTNGVQGLELRYLDSALQCGSNPTQADISVYVYDKDNKFLTKMSKNDTYTSTDIDSVEDLKFRYQFNNVTCPSYKYYYEPNITTYSSNDDDTTEYRWNNKYNVASNSILLGASDTVPSIGGVHGQASIRDMLEGLDSYEELLLVELGTSGTDSVYHDLQDVVLVVDNNPVAKNPVDVELVLAVDVSTSVDSDEFLLQRNGYVDAFNSSAVQEAIEELPNGVAVTMMFWSSDRNEAGKNPVHDIGWYKLVKDGDNIDGLDDFLTRLRGIERSVSDDPDTDEVDSTEVHMVDGVRMENGTDLASAIEESQSLIENNIYDGTRKVIDVSGDGLADDTPIAEVDVDYVTNYISENNLDINNYLTKTDGTNRSNCGRGHYGSKEVANEVAIEHVFCPPVLRARDAAVNAGITINGLPIVAENPNDDASRNREDEVDKFYEYNVIGGTAAFVQRATFDNFSEAVTLKIAREINYYAD